MCPSVDRGAEEECVRSAVSFDGIYLSSLTIGRCFRLIRCVVQVEMLKVIFMS